MKAINNNFERIAFFTIALLMVTFAVYSWITYGTPQFYFNHS